MSRSSERTTHVVVMGVSGSGKTTVAEDLAGKLGWAFAEADEFHPQANIDKMRAGHGLDDEDRWPWLEAMRDWMRKQEAEGHNTVVTCSALKRTYRDLLRGAGKDVFFVHLDGSSEVLGERMSGRKGHFMPASLLDSQLATLEPLQPDEKGIRVDVTISPGEVIDIAALAITAER